MRSASETPVMDSPSNENPSSEVSPSVLPEIAKSSETAVFSTGVVTISPVVTAVVVWVFVLV